MIEKLVVVIEDFAVSSIMPNVLALYGRHMPETSEATAYVRDSLLRQVRMFFEHPEHDITKIDTIRLYVDGADQAHLVEITTAGLWALLFGTNVELQKESIVREYHRLFTKLGELYDTNKKLKDENHVLKLQNESLEEYNKRLATGIDARCKEIEELRNDKRALNVGLTEEYLKLKEERDSLRVENESLKSENKKLNATIFNLELKADAISNILEAINEKNKSLEERISKIEKDKRVLTMENLDLFIKNGLKES